MDREWLAEHRRKIKVNYVRQLSNLITLERFTEAEELTKKFGSICRLWAIQKDNIKEAALKDGSAKQRLTLKK